MKQSFTDHFHLPSFLGFFFFFLRFLFFYFIVWLCWVFIAACRLSLVAARRGYSLVGVRGLLIAVDFLVGEHWI